MTRTEGRYSVTPAILKACRKPQTYAALEAATGSSAF